MHHVFSTLLLYIATLDEAPAAVHVSEKLELDCKTLLSVGKPANIETVEEKIARQEADFQKALMLMDKCINKVSSGAAAAGGGGGGGAGQSTTGNGLKGTERPTTTQTTSPTTATKQTAEQPVGTDTPMSQLQTQQKHGVTPPDIPSGQDDDVVAQQLRELAEKETDPALRKKYWNQYRKYKGLEPVQ